MKSRNKFLPWASATLALATAFTAQSAQADPGDFDSLPNSLNGDALTAVISTPSNIDNYVYAQEQNGTAFYLYNRDSSSWQQLASSPISGSYGGAAYANGDIYTVYSNNDLSLGVYDIATNTWSTVTNPLGTGSGSGTTNIASDNSLSNPTIVYLLNGTQFVEYNAFTNTTIPRASAPFAVSDLGGLEVYGNFVYALEGGGLNRFARYNISTNTWTTLPNVPSTGAVAGSTIDYENGLLYAYGDAGDNNLYIYNISANTWSTVDIPLFNVSNGGLAYLPNYDEVLFVEGEGGTGFGSFETLPILDNEYNSNPFYESSINPSNRNRSYGLTGTGTVEGSSYYDDREVQVLAPYDEYKIKTSFTAVYMNGQLSGNVSWQDSVRKVTLTSVQLIGVQAYNDYWDMSGAYPYYHDFAIYGTATINGGSQRYFFTLYTEDRTPFFYNSGEYVGLDIPEYEYSFNGEYTQGDTRVVPTPSYSYYTQQNNNTSGFRR